MASDVSICNLALVGLGCNQISSLTEDSEEARKCNAVYSNLRDQELESFPWSFATKRVQLAQLDVTPIFEFAYAFQIPSDCLRTLNIDTTSYSYRIEEDRMLTSYATPMIKYIARITDANKFTQGFTKLLVARIQLELSFGITGSKTQYDVLQKNYDKKSASAKVADLQGSGTPYGIYSDRFIDSRTTGEV